MASPIPPKPPLDPALPPTLGSPLAAPKGTGAPKAPADQLEAPGTRVHAIERTPLGELAEPVSSHIKSAFPLEDLSKIGPSGRWALGFRLDGGGLRLMWLTARRAEETDGKQSLELFFQAHGPMVDRLSRRMSEKGATNAKFAFEASAMPEGAAMPKKDGQTWSPGGDGLTLKQADKWSVDLVPQQPEAMKGAVRIKLFGDDIECTGALKEVINRLGLHALFAPPTPQSLERFKLFRLLWAEAPDRADALRYRPLEDLEDTLEATLAAANLPATHRERKAIDAADLTQARTVKRLKLAKLLFDRSPAAFIAWAKADSNSVHGILPNLGSGSDSDNGLNNALSPLGLTTTSEAYLAAINGPALEAGDARRLLHFGLLVKQNQGLAIEALSREIDAIKLEAIRAKLSEVGIDPAGERVQNLRFEEVYPGYFTVVDPSLPARLFKTGARYLYSTSDNPERVLQMLTSGQKSSMTRFREGVIVQGKSSSSDFGTGGAFSVFTRLVTASAIKKGKAGEAYGGCFSDWGGSRPYKLLLNRNILARLDWYGYNGDNFGRSTNLTAANKSEPIIRTIEENYGISNELMFPVGNAPAYVDFVVCATEDQKALLLTALKDHGWSSFNGKPLEAFIRVSKVFFEHPDDITLESTVRDAIQAALEKPLTKTITDRVKEVAPPAIGPLAQSLVAGLAKEHAEKTAPNSAENNVRWSAQNAGRTALESASAELKDALTAGAIKEAAKAAAESAARDGAKAWALTGSNYGTYQVEQRIKNEVSAQSGALGSAAKAKVDAVVLSLTKPTDATEEAKSAVEAAIHAALREAVNEALNALVEPVLLPKAQAEAASIIEGSYRWNIKGAAQNAAAIAAEEAALGAAPSEAVDAMKALAQAAAKASAEKDLNNQIDSYGPGWIRSAVDTALKAALIPAALEAASAPALDSAAAAHAAEAQAVAATAAQGFQTSFPDRPADLAALPAMASAVITDLAKPLIDRIAREVANATGQEQVDAACKAAIAERKAEIIATATTRVAAEGANQAVRQLITNAARTVANDAVEGATNEAVEEAKTQMAPQLAEIALEAAMAGLEQQWGNWAINQYASSAIQAVWDKP